MNKKNHQFIKKIATLSILLAAGIVLNIVDAIIPMPFGFRLGLANVVGLFVLYVFGFKEAIILSLLRIVIANLLRGLEFNTFMMALTGGIISMTIMWGLKKITPFGIVVISTIGAIFHSAGQLLVAMWLLASSEVMTMLPIMLLTAIPTGILIGIIADRIIKVYQGNKKIDINNL
ncbi:Gx transporter family protein [Acholeplasma sp. OttesenSCG-928-E16]|nr:Gx transporter family protein [Acholeplasma sp. OttesenSCG-928-E16]